MSDIQPVAENRGDLRERFSNGEFEEQKWNGIYVDLISKVMELVTISPKEIHPRMHVIYDLGMDSLQMYELVIGLEEMYNIQLSDEDLEKVQTVADFVGLIYGIIS